MQLSASQKAATAWSAIALLGLFLFWRLAPVLTPFVIAAVLAYALAPLVDGLDRAGGGRIPRLLAVVVVSRRTLLRIFQVPAQQM